MVDQLDAGLLELGDQGGEVLVAGGDRLVEDFLHAARVQLLLELVGQALAVCRLVVKDRDLARDLVVDDVVRGVNALHIVTAAGPEHILEALLGQLRVGRGGRDLQDALLVVDGRSRDRRARAEVAGDELDAVMDELVGYRHRLLGVAGIVADLENQLLAVDAALGVDVLHGQLGAALHLLAEHGVLAGHRACGRDGHVRPCGAAAEQHERRGAHQQIGHTTHDVVLHLTTRLPRTSATLRPGFSARGGLFVDPKSIDKRDCVNAASLTRASSPCRRKARSADTATGTG